jgi:tetratricopeptide (TPR) repeat protein/S1-C subfamily serine protease
MLSFCLSRSIIGCSLLMLPAATAYLTVVFEQPIDAQIPTQTHSEYTGVAKQVDEIAQKITVLINSKNNGNGSGVIVAKEGNTYYVLTAAHVVQNSDNYTLTAPDGQQYQLDKSQMTVLEEVDLAVVQFTSNKTYNRATLARYNIKDNFWVFVSGFPKSSQGGQPQRLLTAGIVAQQEEADFRTKDQYSLSSGGRGLVYTSLSMAGMSGGPVLDSRGYVIGINTAAENEWTTTQAGQNVEINLGFSLGVPIGIFVSQSDKMKVQSQWLQVEPTSPPELDGWDVESIIASLGRVRVPDANASAIDWLNYGNQLWRFRQFEEAVNAFEKAISLKSDFYQAYYGKGLALWYADKDLEALAAFEQTTQIAPNFSAAWRYQGIILIMLEKYDLALAAYNKVIELQPDNFVLHVERGVVLSKLKRFTEAVTAYNDALKLKSHSWTYNNRGITYKELKQYQKAIEDFNRAIALNPDYVDAYYNRGNTYKELKQYQRAIDDYNRAIALKPDYADAYYTRGTIYANLRQYQKAIEDFNIIIVLKPEFAPAYHNRGNVYHDLKDYQRAIADYNRAIALNPEFAEAYGNRGIAYTDLKDYQKAIADFNKTIQLNPEDTLAYYNRGIAYTDLKDYQKAIADFNKTIQLNPESAEAYGNRGLAYSQLGDLEKAIADMERATQLFCQQRSPNCQQAQEFLRQLQQSRN